MQISFYEHPSWLTNCYLVYEDNCKEAVLIDAGAPVDYFDSEIKEKELEISAIFLTHHHGDHTTHLSDWMKRFECPVYAHESELEYLEVSGEPLSGSEEQVCGSLSVRSIHTPGHTKGHLCFLVNERFLFTGDLLFKGSVGGTIASGHGTFEELRDSVLNKVLSLSPEIVIYPGHSVPSTIRQELQENEFVKAWKLDEPPVCSKCSVKGEVAELVLLGPDYDGGGKVWVRFADHTGKITDEVVPGFWVKHPV